MFVVSAQAAPFLVSNAQTGATTYQITGGPSWLPSTVTATNGAMRVDLSNYVAGTWTLKAKACKTDPNFGPVCSPEGTFTLTCPSNTFTAPILSIEK